MIDRRKTERRRLARKTRQFGRFLRLVERRCGERRADNQKQKGTE